jgi:hypothetical protein
MGILVTSAAKVRAPQTLPVKQFVFLAGQIKPVMVDLCLWPEI